MATTTTTTLLADWQIDIAGVRIGHGTRIPIADIDGLGTPDKRTGDKPIPGEDGSYPGADTLSPRALVITAGIRTPGDPGAALDLFADLEQAAAAPTVRLTPGATDVLRVQRPGRPPRRQYGRFIGVEAISMDTALYGWIPVRLKFAALDPTWYSDATEGLTLPLDISAQAGQGFTAPLRAPMTTGTASPSTRPGWVTNGGRLPTWPTIRITGPVVNPKVWIQGTGTALQFNVTLGAGETLDVETRPGSRNVTRNSGGFAAGALSRASRLDLFRLPPGRSEIRWSAQDATNTARLALTWRDAHSSI